MIISCMYSKKIYIDTEQTQKRFELLTGESIKIGQWIDGERLNKADIKTQTVNVYVVKPLDTYSSVAKKLGVSEEYLKLIAKTKNLFVGQKITF